MLLVMVVVRMVWWCWWCWCGDHEDDRLRDSLLSDLQLALAQLAPSPELGAAATHVPSCNIQV